MSEKRIAKIYYDAHVLLTKKGELYGYVIQDNGKPRCNKLTAQEKIAFWERRTVKSESEMTVWNPVSNVGAINCAEIKFMKYSER